MSDCVTPPDKLAGILPVVITGGRPALADRITARFLRDLHGVTADPVWIVRDDDAPAYERDEHEIVIYSRRWAEEYAAGHWIGHEPFEPGAFLGAFPGREFACRLAEQRGCWAVLQLDDNLLNLRCFVGSGAGRRAVRRAGGLALYADILAAVALSTNGATVGTSLDVQPPASRRPDLLARTGCPTCLFLERTDGEREPWLGPMEDDFMHAIQYGRNPTGATALVVYPLLYDKWWQGRTGMRSHYDGTRPVGLQRVASPDAALAVKRARVNGVTDPRVFRRIDHRAVRTPLVIRDRRLYNAAADRMAGVGRDMIADFRASRTEQLRRRAEKAHGKTRTRAASDESAAAAGRDSTVADQPERAASS